MTQLPPNPEPSGTGVPACYRHPGRETYIRCQRCDRSICPDCMRDAAVGFQCPECVAEGRRTTRQARTAYGGQHSANPAATSIVIIGLNLLVWGVIQATGRSASRLYELFALAPTGRCAEGGGYYPGVPTESVCSAVGGGAHWAANVTDGAAWQLLTSAFTHVEVWHIGLNMLALYVLGPQLEQVLGRVRFLALYLLSALAGSVAAYWLSPEQGTTAGASTAVFGLIGALVVVAYKVGGNVQQILIWLGLNLVITFTFPNISWQGHLGGLLGGLAVAAALVYAPRGSRRSLVQAVALVAIAVVLLAAAAARAVVLS